MRFRPLLHLIAICAVAPGVIVISLRAETVRVATYNLENYLSEPTPSRPHLKSADSKAKIREGILALRADVIALQEVGDLAALEELRESLKRGGIDYSHWEFVTGSDTNIHVAILSRFPFGPRRSHTNETFLLHGRRFRASRGFAEVAVNVSPTCSFTVLTAHLKSKRPIPEADEEELRFEEAKQLRRIIDTELAFNPMTNLIVLGDFNDTRNSDSVRMLVGRGKMKLTDTRPAERNGDSAVSQISGWDPRNITWTHYYGVEDSYNRIDYILLSPSLSRRWVRSETYVLAIPNWGLASDHRPLVVAFESGSN